MEQSSTLDLLRPATELSVQPLPSFGPPLVTQRMIPGGSATVSAAGRLRSGDLPNTRR
jgi:hypothetical protein